MDNHKNNQNILKLNMKTLSKKMHPNKIQRKMINEYSCKAKLKEGHLPQWLTHLLENHSHIIASRFRSSFYLLSFLSSFSFLNYFSWHGFINIDTHLHHSFLPPIFSLSLFSPVTIPRPKIITIVQSFRNNHKFNIL